MMSHSFRRIALAHDLLPAVVVREREAVPAPPAEVDVPEQTQRAYADAPALCTSDG